MGRALFTLQPSVVWDHTNGPMPVPFLPPLCHALRDIRTPQNDGANGSHCADYDVTVCDTLRVGVTPCRAVPGMGYPRVALDCEGCAGARPAELRRHGRLQLDEWHRTPLHSLVWQAAHDGAIASWGDGWSRGEVLDGE